jgi:hypothetical protein
MNTGNNAIHRLSRSVPWVTPIAAVLVFMGYDAIARHYRLHGSSDGYRLVFNVALCLLIAGGVASICLIADECGRSRFLSLAALVVNTLLFLLFYVYVPSYFEAISRVKVARVRNEMRQLSESINQYYKENGSYPAWAIGKDSANGFLNDRETALGMPTFKVSSNGEKSGILAPPYPEDILLPYSAKGATFCYYANARGYVLISCGLDRDYDMDPVQDLSSEGAVRDEALVAKSYDATNGTLSSGDVIMVVVKR